MTLSLLHRVAGVLVLSLASMACSTGPRPTTIASGAETRAQQAVVDGVPVTYHVFGSGPVVIAHPGGPGGEWGYLRMPEVEQVATVVYIEPFGTGVSGRLADPNGYTIEAYVKAVESVRAALGVDQVVLLGHSHGGFVAQGYALTHPAHLRGLILYDTSPVTGGELGSDIMSNLEWFEHEPWFAEAKAGFATFSEEKTDADATAGMKRTMPFSFADWTHRSHEFAAYRAQARIWIGPRQTVPPEGGAFSTEETSFDVRPRLHEISAPTLILVGAKDAICSEKMARMAQAGIQGSRLVVLAHSGHMGHLEEPAEHSRAIREFLATLAP
ncbi:alpha/beta fold hydrolase [Corallococcus llansteffanensis]|uniref:Alpha/beta hydrolase n=1 Tax=Corallococcus llansteffanensis TaxID=2316731 RepID=A0A3A8QCX0_9BACT|nr:alpha/beta hydrolase [Corallococcus llansteffanensis]RKH66466.1 alpha/beta hydrolase [Corallococcus llansteffanensis]